jgi:hypothetical protein
MIDKRTDNCDRSKFTLDQPINYQVKIAGQLSENWSDWINEMNIQIEADTSGFATTTLTGTLDQAALIGLLRRLYYLGFPLISINCIQSKKESKK